MRCALFGKPERPAVCVSLRPTEEMCGCSPQEALAGLTRLEFLTQPPSIRNGVGGAGAASARIRAVGMRFLK